MLGQEVQPANLSWRNNHRATMASAEFLIGFPGFISVIAASQAFLGVAVQLVKLLTGEIGFGNSSDVKAC